MCFVKMGFFKYEFFRSYVTSPKFFITPLDHGGCAPRRGIAPPHQWSEFLRLDADKAEADRVNNITRHG